MPNVKIKTTIFFFLVLTLFLLPILSAVTFENGTILYEGLISNTTVQIFQNSTADEWDINESFGGIIITNLSTDGARFTNINATYNAKIGFYGITNALIYYSNYSIAGNSNINSNDGNITVTIQPNNYSYVLDNFNLTEGTPRTNSPLWFSSSSNTIKHIASNLTNTINSTIVFNVIDCNIASITYVSNSSDTSYSPAYTCSNNAVTIPLLNGIEQSSNSNVITISYSAIDGGGESPSGGGGDTQINNTYGDSVLIEITNLSRTFIYQSNETIYTFLNGNLNITLEGNEYFYMVNYEELLKFSENQGTIAYDVSGNSNDGTITGATWNNTETTIALISAIDYTLVGSNAKFQILDNDLDRTGINVTYTYTTKLKNYARDISNDYTTGVVGFFGSVPIFFTLLAVVVIILIISLVILAVNKFGGSNQGLGSQGFDNYSQEL